MEVVAPLRVETVAPLFGATNQLRIIQVALPDQNGRATKPPCLIVDRGGHLLKNMERAEVEDAMHGIEPERIDVILGDPIQSVVDHESTDLVATGAIVVDGAPPWRSIRLR